MQNARTALWTSFLLTASAGGVAAQSNWVDWVDETSTRISGAPATTTADVEEKDFSIADLDNDGDDDVVVVRKVPFSTVGGAPNVLLMNENGVLTERTSTLIPGFLTADDARDVVVFDCDNDGWKDICVINTFGEQPRLFMNDGESGGVFQGFTENTSWFSPLFDPTPKFCAVDAGDLDGDGFLDLFMVDYNNDLEDVLLMNNGDGTFTDETSTRLAAGFEVSGFGTSCFIRDFNMDGHQDILKLTTLTEPKEVQLLLNDSTGNFTVMQTLPFQEVYMLDVPDLNNDGRPDIYCVSDNQDYVLYNDSTNLDGTINVTQAGVIGSSKTQGFGGNVHSADLDRDGFPDMGVADVDTDAPGCARRFTVLLNRIPGGNVGANDPNNGMNLPWHSAGTFDFGWIDLNEDGYQDMIQGTCTGLKVWIMEPFAVSERYGNGCAGTKGVPGIHSTLPDANSGTFEVSVSNGLNGAVPLLFTSFNAPVTTNSCDLLFGFPFFLSFVGPAINAAGDSTLNFGTLEPELDGVRLYMQWLFSDPMGGLKSKFALSRGLDVNIRLDTLP